MTITELKERAQRVKALGDRVREHAERVHARAIDAAVQEEFTALMRGELRHFPKPHIDKVLDNLRAEKRRERGPRAAVALFEAEQALMAIGPALKDVRDDTRRAPDVETAWLQRSRGERSAAVYWAIKLFAVQKRASLLTESASWTLQRWHDTYTRALADPTDPDAAVTIALIEDLHGDGYTGALPANDAEALAAAHGFKKLIDTTRDARIPREVTDAEAIVEAVSRVAQQARDQYGVRPVNPANAPHDPEVQAAAAEAAV
jgi:hypothetical protein